MVWATLTADSAFLFDLEKCGDEVTCLNSQVEANCVNAWLTVDQYPGTTVIG